MKKIISLLAMGIMASAASVMFAGTPINPSELPKECITFLNKHFPGDNIRKAEVDREHRGLEYDVDLNSGAEVDFKEDGSWKEVKATYGKAVPAAIVPAAIAKYVATNHPGRMIVEISVRRGGYEVELDNDIDLYLTKEGTVMQPRQGGRRNR